jgi:propanediol dehydratase small subunit
MSITIPGDLAAEFGRAGEAVEVRGPDGRVLGTFTPAVRPPEPNISEEELRRREEDTTSKTYTAAEVEAKLRELRCTR